MPSRRLGRALLLASLALLLAGCRLELRTTLDLARVDAGVLTVEVGLDDDLTERLGAAGVDPLRGLDAVATPGWRVEPVLGRTGVRLVTDVRAGTVGERVDALQREFDGSSGRLLQDLSLTTMPSGGAELRGTIGAVLPDVVGRVGADAATTEDLRRAATVPGAYLYVFEVVAPTEVVAHDADVVRDARLSWTVAAGDTRDVFVRLAPPPRFTRLQLLGAAAALLLLAVVLLVLARPRRRVRTAG